MKRRNINNVRADYTGQSDLREGKATVDVDEEDGPARENIALSLHRRKFETIFIKVWLRPCQFSVDEKERMMIDFQAIRTIQCW